MAARGLVVVDRGLVRLHGEDELAVPRAQRGEGLHGSLRVVVAGLRCEIAVRWHVGRPARIQAGDAAHQRDDGLALDRRPRLEGLQEGRRARVEVLELELRVACSNAVMPRYVAPGRVLTTDRG